MNIMLPRRPQVLVALLALAAGPSASLAQPPEAPAAGGRGLLPLAVDQWVKQSGGLTRLTLKMENATAEEIAREVSKQTGLDVVADDGLRPPRAGPEAPRFSVEATGQPLFEALEQWSRDGKFLGLGRDPRLPRQWRIVRQAAPNAQLQITWKAFTAQIGPGTLQATELSTHINRSMRLADLEGPRPGWASDHLSVAALARFDPRLEFSVADIITEVQSAQDDQGRSLLPSPANGSTHNWGDGTFRVEISLKAPQLGATHVRQVKGTLRLAVVTRQEVWEIPLAARPEDTAQAQKTFDSDSGPLTMQLSGMKRHERGNGWELSMVQKIRLDGPSRLFKPYGQQLNGLPGDGESYKSNAFRTALSVLDAQNRPLFAQHLGGGSDAPDGFSTTRANFYVSASPPGIPGEEKGTPAKIVVRVPLAWREVEIPFELKNLPLP